MKVLDFILCDDVRLEISNKYTLVGVYNDQFILQAKVIEDIKLPTLFRLAFYLRIDLENEERVRQIDFNISGKAIEPVKGIFKFNKFVDSRPVILTSPFVMTIVGQGQLDIEFIVRDGQGAQIDVLKPSSQMSIFFKKV